MSTLWSDVNVWIFNIQHFVKNAGKEGKRLLRLCWCWKQPVVTMGTNMKIWSFLPEKISQQNVYVCMICVHHHIVVYPQKMKPNPNQESYIFTFCEFWYDVQHFEPHMVVLLVSLYIKMSLSHVVRPFSLWYLIRIDVKHLHAWIMCGSSDFLCDGTGQKRLRWEVFLDLFSQKCARITHCEDSWVTDWMNILDK